MRGAAVLVALCLWGIAFGGVYLAIRRARLSAAVTLALLVVKPILNVKVRGRDRQASGNG